MRWRLLPWPSRRDRKAHVAAARASAEKARRDAAHAARLERDLQRIVTENHWAEAIWVGWMHQQGGRRQ